MTKSMSSFSIPASRIAMRAASSAKEIAPGVRKSSGRNLADADDGGTCRACDSSCATAGIAGCRGGSRARSSPPGQCPSSRRRTSRPTVTHHRLRRPTCASVLVAREVEALDPRRIHVRTVLAHRAPQAIGLRARASRCRIPRPRPRSGRCASPSPRIGSMTRLTRSGLRISLSVSAVENRYSRLPAGPAFRGAVTPGGEIAHDHVDHADETFARMMPGM